MRLTRAALLAIACIAAFAVTACGNVSTEATGTNPGDGKQIFSDAGCGGCHTFKPADSTGTSGPTLDNTSLNQDQIAEQIAKGGGGMPSFAGDLNQAQIDAVAAFIAESPTIN